MRDIVRVRKWSTPAQRAKTVAEFRASGLTQREFAAQARISVSSLCNWLRQERNLGGAERKVSFVEIPALGAAAIGRPYRVQFPGGTTVEVPPGFASTEVKELLGLIREL